MPSTNPAITPIIFQYHFNLNVIYFTLNVHYFLLRSSKVLNAHYFNLRSSNLLKFLQLIIIIIDYFDKLLVFLASII